MSRLLLAFACFLVLSAPRLVAQPDASPHGSKGAKQQILKLEDQWKDATLSGDVAAMDKLLANDYVGISWTGQVNTKAMQLDRTRSRNLALTQFDVSDLKVKIIAPGVAIVNGLVDVDGTNDGSNIRGEFRYIRVYERLPSGVWQITHFEATRILPNAGRPDHPHRPRPQQPPPPDK
jgi:ketosteroid isomerase-like protein